jgi:predicted nucleic acid-binding protein
MPDNFENNIPELIKKSEAEAEKTLRVILLKLQADAVKILHDKKVNVTGELARNIRTQIIKEIGKMIGVIGVGANVPYAIYRHEGTKPHFPPLEPIQKWVIKRGMVKGSRGKALTSISAIKARKSSDTLEAQVKSIAYLIARKIAKKGTEGLPFLQMAMNLNQSFITEQLSKLKLA